MYERNIRYTVGYNFEYFRRLVKGHRYIEVSDMWKFDIRVTLRFEAAQITVTSVPKRKR